MSEEHTIEQKRDAYLAFLKTKIPQAEVSGFEPPSPCHPSLFPHQRDICEWACRGGRRAVFANFGLGKTRIHLQLAQWVTMKTGGKYLIVAPLGVRQEFTLSDGPAMGIDVQFVRTDADVAAATASVLITNYESVRDGKIDLSQFAGAGLDEAAALRSFGSLTYQTFLRLFKAVPYRFVFTATPSPNRYKELIHYGGFLGIMDTGEALTRFFQRDSSEAGNLTLYPHMEKQFWMWLHSWATFLQRPSDLGHSDDGYQLPPLHVHWHRVESDQRKAWTQVDDWGQAQLLRDDAQGLKEGAEIKRESIELRVAKLIQIISSENVSAQQGLLREKSGEGEGPILGELPREQGKNRPDETEGLHDGIPEDLRSEKAHRRGTSGEKQASQREVSFGPSIQREGESPRAQLGEREPGKEESSTAEREVLPSARNFQGDARLSRRGVCDLPNGTIEQTPLPVRGPLPCDGEDSGNTLQQLQPRTGPFSGQSGAPRESNILPGQFVVWCDLNAEQEAIERALKKIGVTCSSLTGSQDIEEREALVMDWKQRRTDVFLSKPVMYGAGVNLQQCHTMIYIGVGYKFADFIQGIHRIHRFQQKHPCHVHIIHLDSEDAIVESLKAKWRRHDELMARMTEILKTHRLSTQTTMELIRTLGCERAEVRSKTFTVVRNDCILETQQMPADSVDMVCTSIPFGNQYEYSPSYNDLGHNTGNEAFFAQMDFLVPELLRVLRPGRIAAVHVKDRIQFGNVTGFASPTVEPFSDLTTVAFRKAGFVLMARITIDTDVVRENAQTYRLGWSENAKDSTKMGAGMPEYVLVFRKLPSDLANAYADTPVTKSKADYTRADWQLDAAGLWRDSGNRLLDPELMMGMTMEEIKRWWTQYSLAGGYAHEEHVALAKALEKRGKLPSSFMLFPAISRNKDVWTDIARMRTLNTEQSRRAEEKHVCPLSIDVVTRLIRRYTNKGDVVLDPFSGIGTVPYLAVKMGRIGHGIELNEDYWRFGVGYCEAAESEITVPTLFDMWSAGLKGEEVAQ